MIGGRKNIIELAMLGPDTSNMTAEQVADLEKFHRTLREQQEPLGREFELSSAALWALYAR